MKSFVGFFVLCTIAMFTLNQTFAADKQPTPEERAYKFRTSLFQTFSWKFGQLVGAKKQNDETAFTKHANDLVYLASMLEEGFQIENSLPDGSKAKPAIWEDFDKFQEKARNLATAAKGLTESGAMADFDPRGFGSKACGSCHRDFRIKDEE